MTRHALIECADDHRVGHGRRAVLATVIESVIAGYDALAAGVLVFTHVMVASVQVQPVPLIAVAVRPAGSELACMSRQPDPA
jgi:hypothetical protein